LILLQDPPGSYLNKNYVSGGPVGAATRHPPEEIGEPLKAGAGGKALKLFISRCLAEIFSGSFCGVGTGTPAGETGREDSGYAGCFNAGAGNPEKMNGRGRIFRPPSRSQDGMARSYLPFLPLPFLPLPFFFS